MPALTKPSGAPRHLVYGNAVTPPNMVHLPAYMAKELGYFDAVGLDVEIKSFEGGVGALRGGIAGGLDIVGTSSDPFFAASLQGGPVKAIGSYAPKLSVVITSASDIKKPEDLKGRKIGIQEVGGFNEVMARLLLATVNLKPADVQYVNTSTAGRVPALVNGQIEASTLHIDQYYAALGQKADLVTLAKMWEIAPDWWYSAFVVTDDKLKNNRAELVDFMTAVMRAQRFMYMDREKTIELAMKLIQRPRDVVERSYDDLVRGGVWNVNDGMPTNMLNYTVDHQVELGTINSKPDLTKIIDRSIVEEAMKRNGGAWTGDPRWY
jgi:ABC-type nitrate/sulfonate/bicarbonate transport system substrate-binding protein